MTKLLNLPGLFCWSVLLFPAASDTKGQTDEEAIMMTKNNFVSAVLHYSSWDHYWKANSNAITRTWDCKDTNDRPDGHLWHHQQAQCYVNASLCLDKCQSGNVNGQHGIRTSLPGSNGCPSNI